MSQLSFESMEVHEREKNCYIERPGFDQRAVVVVREHTLVLASLSHIRYANHLPGLAMGRAETRRAAPWRATRRLALSRAKKNRTAGTQPVIS